MLNIYICRLVAFRRHIYNKKKIRRSVQWC